MWQPPWRCRAANTRRPDVAPASRARPPLSLAARGARVQDTITGFLLAGVGNVDLRRKSNFLVVDSSALAPGPVCRPRGPLICVFTLRRHHPRSSRDGHAHDRGHLQGVHAA